MTDSDYQGSYTGYAQGGTSPFFSPALNAAGSISISYPLINASSSITIWGIYDWNFGSVTKTHVTLTNTSTSTQFTLINQSSNIVIKSSSADRVINNGGWAFWQFPTTLGFANGVTYSMSISFP